VVISVVLAVLWSGELASLLQGGTGTSTGLGRRQPRSGSFRCSSSGSLVDQFVDSNFPMTKLFFVSATQGEELQIIVTAPPYCKRVLSWRKGQNELRLVGGNIPEDDRGVACVTLFKKIRPFNNNGVFLFVLGPPGVVIWRVLGICFLRIELLFPTFFAFCGWRASSLQQRMIRWNRKTWYSRSTSDLVTTKTSSSKSSPKLEI